jgi:hypothetical protein
MHRRFSGRRIDMETLYELYFDQELDFVIGSSDASERVPVCLLKDVLSKRGEFVDYTLSFRTHLWFLVSKWIPDVLHHTKARDVGQVVPHRTLCAVEHAVEHSRVCRALVCMKYAWKLHGRQGWLDYASTKRAATDDVEAV